MPRQQGSSESDRQRGQQSQTGTSSTRQHGQSDTRRSQQGAGTMGSSQPMQESPRSSSPDSRKRRMDDVEEVSDAEEDLPGDSMRNE